MRAKREVVMLKINSIFLWLYFIWKKYFEFFNTVQEKHGNEEKASKKVAREK